MTFELLTDPIDIGDAFSIWRNAITEHATWHGRYWWLPDERIAVGNRNSADMALGEFVVLGSDATFENVTVQLNEPAQYGNENPLSGIGRDASGRLHLLRQGVLHKNAQSDRVDVQFAERTGLAPIDLTIGDRAAKRSWFVVTPLDVPSRAICRNVGSFVERCSVARGAEIADEARRDEERLDDLFGKPEQGGETSGQPSMNHNRRRQIQGEVWLALQKLLNADGRDLRKPRHARGYEVDGEIVVGSERLLLEIKTGTSASEVYGGVGQLLLYPRLLPRLAKHRRVLLLPGLPTAPLAQAVSECGIELLSYDLDLADGRVDVDFSPAFLTVCGL
ncbi:hypothetical protein [Sphingomonas sp. NFX23]|uniref:hypothetical protein n=1 Tax=Sphingomonas sp. NFX23 TaxID=2819532 RepID=UPI003CF98215